jgi:hypothetical protein
LLEIPPWRILACHSSESKRENGSLGGNLAQPCRAIGSNQINTILSTSFSVLISTGASWESKNIWPSSSENSFGKEASPTQKKLHLVNWNIVSSSKEHGGLGIRDPKLINIALGANLLWRLVTGSKEWWKSTIVKKYRMGNRKRCLDLDPVCHFGSPIWKLLQTSIPFFEENLSWVPGNGK